MKNEMDSVLFIDLNEKFTQKTYINILNFNKNN